MGKGTEVKKADAARASSGFYARYMSGSGLDVGYRGYGGENDTVLPNALGVDEGYPGYDGFKLPFPDESQDFVFSSHTLEHIRRDPKEVVREWFRVVKTGGFLVITVPHAWLYEKKANPPSLFATGSQEHVHFFTTVDLVRTIQDALLPNSFRIVHLTEIDENYDYSKGPGQIPETTVERYEIECVIKRIKPPGWTIT